jgi:hypothetical protein
VDKYTAVNQEDMDMVEIAIDPGEKRKRWLADFRTGLMKKEVDHVLELAWEVHMFDYRIAEWRHDMDNGQVQEEGHEVSRHRQGGGQHCLDGWKSGNCVQPGYR